MDAKEATRLLQERIKLLHEYNDVKETTIVLMTHASMIRDMHHVSLLTQ